MKNSLRFFTAKLVLIVLLFSANSASAQATFNSASSGNWTDASRWTIVSGSDADGVPDANDTVIIISSHNITVNSGSQACASLTVGPLNSNTSTLTFASGTTLTVSGIVSLGNSGSTLRRGSIVMTNGGTLICEGFALNNSGSNNFSEGTGTVVLTATNTLPSTVFNAFRNLTISGGTTTTASAITVAGNLVIDADSEFKTGTSSGHTLSVSGTTSVSGTLTLANTGTKTFTGAVTVNEGGTWNETGASTVNFANNLNVNGTFAANTGSHAFTGSGTKSINGASVSIPSLSVTGTVNNNTELTVSNTLAGYGTLVNTAGSTLNFGGSSISPSLTATATGNVVNYNRNGNQSVKAAAYANMIASGSGIKSFPGGMVISENLSIEYPATVDLASLTTSNASTLTLGGAGQSSGTWGGSGSSATYVNTGYFEASTVGRLNVGTNTCSGSTWTGLSNNNWNTAANWCGGVPTASSDVIIPPGMPNSPNIPASTTAVCRSLTINSGATLTLANSASAVLNIGGDFINDGAFTQGAASTVSFVGSSAQIIGGTSSTVFSNLTINTESASTTVVNAAKALATTGDLTVTRGNLVLQAVDAGYNIAGDLTVAPNGTLTHNVDWDSSQKQMNVGGNIAIDGVYTKGTAGRAHVQMNGSGRTVHTGTSSLDIFTLNTTGTITCDGTLTVNNNFWAMIGVAGGSFSTAGHNVTGHSGLFNFGGTININGGSLTITGGMQIGHNGGLGGVLNLTSGTLTTDALYLGADAFNGVFNHSGGTANINGPVTILSTTPASAYICTNSPIVNIAGNWNNNGTYTKANETITFTGATAISGSSVNSFHNVAIAGSLTAPSANMNVSGSWTNNGTFTANGGTVTLNGSAQQTIGGSSATTFHNLTLSNAAGAVLSASQNVNNTLSLTGGSLNIGSHNLTMGANAGAIAGTFSASRMIVTGGGQVRKMMSSNGSYVFPIGDNTGTTEYSPVTLNVTGSGYTNAFIGVSVADAKHPNNSSPNHFLTRYWNVSQSGIASCTANVTATYINTAADVTGTLSSMRSAQLNGTFHQVNNPWLRSVTAPSATTLTYNGAAISAGQVSSFTAISGATPSAGITGGGITVCQGSAPSLTAVATGDAPFAYSWTGLVSGSASQANAIADCSSIGTNGYTVIVRDANGIASPASATSNVIVVATPQAGSLTPSPAAGNICAGTTVSATATVGNGGAGIIADELEVSLSGGAFTSYVSGTPINTDGQTSVVIRTRRTASGSNCTASDYNTVTWTMNAPATAGTISGGNATVCSGTNSTLLTVSGHSGNIQWQSSADGNSWNNIDGETATTYTANNLTSTTYFRVVTANGSCAPAQSDAVVINVSPVSVAGSISGATTVCAGTNSTMLTLSGYVGSIQWQSSADNIAFTDIDEANSDTYTANNLTQTTYFRAVVSSGVCSAATTFESSEITVVPQSVAGSILGAGSVCPGSDVWLTLSGHTGNIQWQSSADDASFVDIPGATAETFHVVNVTSTTYFRAMVINVICEPVASASVMVSAGNTTVWDGTSWSNGAPTAVDTAIINGNYTSSTCGGNITACTLTVNNAAVVITSGQSVTLNGALVVNDGSTFTLENNANLLQTANVENTGEIIVKRKSSALKRLDYTLWSSPVDGQDLFAFSPATVSNRFYIYNTQTNQYNAITPSGTDFQTGKGYLIRTPNNHPTFAWIWNGQFRGVPHNGDYTVTMADHGEGKRFNLVGNPYPSPIDIDAFVAANADNITGTLYFWRKTNNELSPSYCSWAAGTFIDNGEAQVFDPQDVIRTGQGFFVEGTGNGTSLVFNNEMRINDNANQFFRQANTSNRSRIWLNATGTGGQFAQMALVYVEGALTNEVDMFDGRYINDGDIALNSMINGVDYIINGREPFVPSDVVPLSFKATTAGSYSIAIDHLDGLFTGEQGIYLRDNQTGIVHDLKAAPYAFTSEAGTVTNRFEVIYQLPLGTDNPELAAEQVVIYKQGGNFVVDAGSVVIDNVQVFDIRGRMVLQQKDVNATQTVFDGGEVNQVLIVKVTSDDNLSVTKKVLN